MASRRKLVCEIETCSCRGWVERRGGRPTWGRYRRVDGILDVGRFSYRGGRDVDDVFGHWGLHAMESNLCVKG